MNQYVLIILLSFLYNFDSKNRIYNLQSPSQQFNYTPGKVIYVDSSAQGTNDGNSWVNAFTKLQDALNASAAEDTIKVAKGTYFPDEGVGYVNNERLHTFNILSSRKVIGSYPGLTGDTLGKRNTVCYPSILSGEIQLDGFLSNNSYHVVTTSYVDSTTVIDGFIIRDGWATATGTRAYAGGLYNNATGAGRSSSPVIMNCSFINNRAIGGGAIYNHADYGTSLLKLINCKFIGNTASNAGAIANTGLVGKCNPMIINCLFSENTAFDYGGAIYNYGVSGECKPQIINTLFYKNHASDNGGAIYNIGGNIPIYGVCRPEIVNSIFWKNTATLSGPVLYNNAAFPRISYSLVQTSYSVLNSGCTNCVDTSLGYIQYNTDPLFISETNKDFSLLPSSLAIDSGLNSANNQNADITGAQRIINGNIDIGPYEYRNSCPVCITGNEINSIPNWYLDVDGDGHAVSSQATCVSPGYGYSKSYKPTDDCNDNNSSIYPGSVDNNCNGMDEDCDGLVDEDYVPDNCKICQDGSEINLSTIWFLDNDGDGHASVALVACFYPGSGYTNIIIPVDDCNDNDSLIHAGIQEINCNGIDDDCDGFVDNDDSSATIAPIWYLDIDQDGFGDPDSLIFSCIHPVGYVENNLDLCPLDSNKTSPEICGCNIVDLDLDGDQLANCIDSDDDNDGQADLDELNCGSDPINAQSKSSDNENDNIPDCLDTDDDNDGVMDTLDNCPITINSNQNDIDGDGLGDTCDFVINVDGIISNIADSILTLSLPQGLGNSLINKMSDALARYCAGNKNEAIKRLNSFINQVQAQSGNQIPTSEANYLIVLTQVIIAAINSGSIECPFANLKHISQGFIKRQSEFILFPNPATQKTWIDFSGKKKGMYTVHLNDIRGVALKSWKFNIEDQKLMCLDLTGMTSGLFFVKVQSEEHEAEILKLIKE